MAWLGAIVALGLIVLGLDVLRERLGDRRLRRRAELGVSDSGWSRQRRLTWIAVGVGALVVVLGAVLWLRGNEDPANTDQLNVLPKATSSSTTSTTSTTTTIPDPGRPPSQVRVAVVNSSGVTGAAAQRSGALGALGYAMAGLANGAPRAGTAVQCRSGFEKEAEALVRNVGGTAKVEPFPTAPPPEVASADCLVVLGT